MTEEKKTRPKRKKGPIERLHPQAARVRAWFFSDSWLASVLWFVIAAALIAALVWYFVFSPYGAPAKPVYAGF